MAKARPILFALSWVLFVGVLQAEFSRETGAFVLRNYSGKEYNGASPENWAVAEDPRGIVYVANTDGLLQFDGVSWHLYRLANGSEMHTVAVDPKGTVYVGGHGDFGFLKPGASGTAQIVSLIDRIPQKDRQFSDIWRILPTSEGVYFSSNYRLFRLNPDGTMKVWPPAKSFGRAFLVSGVLHLKTREQGLLAMRGDQLKPVPGGMRFANTAVEGAVPIEGGAIVATSDRLFRVTSSAIEEFPTKADKYFTEKTIYSVGMLPGNELAVGTRKGGLVLIGPDGSVDRTLTKADGLPDDFVTAIYPDTQGGVWVAGYGGGISRFNPGLTRFDRRTGMGSVSALLRAQHVVYAGSKSGLFSMSTASGALPQFAPVSGIDSLVWSLIPYQDGLLAATDRGVYFVRGNEATQVLQTRVVVFDVTASLHDPDTIYAGGRNFVSVLHKSGASWQTAAEVSIPGQEIRTVLEDRDGKVWAAAADTIWRIDPRQQPIVPERFDKANGVPGGGFIHALRFQNRVVFGTDKGLRRFDEPGKHFVPDTSLGTEYADGSRVVLNLFTDRAGNVWITGKGYHDLLLKGPGGYKRVPAPLIESGIDEIWSMSLDDDGTAWAQGADGVLFRYQRNIAGNPDRGFNVLTRGVEALPGMNAVYGGAGDPEAVRLPYSSNALRFEFAAPFYELPSAVEYRWRLDGSESDWSMWSHDSHADYKNLSEHPGFRFRVQARSPHGSTAETAYSFAVLPPWYRTWWAYGIYGVLGGFGVWGIVRWRTKQLEADKRRLEQTVEERTVEIRQQRDEIHVQERKSHALLLNILPSTVADELKSTGAVKPVGFDDVTVCFTDFVGFTLSSEKLSPDRLVDALNEYFTAFDEIIERYGLEKLKTIGDSYMFASGLPAQRDSHAVDAALAALEMAEVVKRFACKTGGTGWNIRIGLHSGPVVAGVVGIRKFAFDIWGNTVNFAARMESSGVPGSVNMSERTCRLTRELIDCEFRGQVKIKEGRELPMFLARGPVRDFEARYLQEFGYAPQAMPRAAQANERTFQALVN